MLIVRNFVTALLLLSLGVAFASPPRTLPHDHTSRGKGGDLGDITLGETTLTCIKDTNDICMLIPESNVLAYRGTLNNNIQLKFETTSGGDTASIFANQSAFELRNEVHGDDVIISAEDLTGAARDLIQCDPDDICEFFYDGTVAAATQFLGFDIFDPVCTTGVDCTPNLAFNNGSTDLLSITVTDAATVTFNGTDDGAIWTVRQDDSAGADANLLLCDPDEDCDVLGWWRAFKDGDTIRSSTTTPADDPDLSIAIPGQGYYSFRVFLLYDSQTTSDFRMDFNYTAGIVEHQHNCQHTENDNSFQTPQFFGSGTYVTDMDFTTLSTSDHAVMCTGFFEMNAGGTMTVRWSQVTSQVTNTTVNDGSWLRVRRLGDDT